VDLFGVEPVEAMARIDRLKGRRLADWRAEWLRQLKLA
jgi:hypothetical protein